MENRKLQQGIDRAQQELREAAAASKRLQQEAARRGQDWLRKYVSVHLSVMNPADVSYRTSRLIGYLPIAPDNMVRDHRKIAFCDLTELDPAKGEALRRGRRRGAVRDGHLGGPRGPTHGPRCPHPEGRASRYLKANGFTDANIPPPLRPLPKPLDYDERVRALEARGWTATAMQVHNDRGFARANRALGPCSTPTACGSGRPFYQRTSTPTTPASTMSLGARGDSLDVEAVQVLRLVRR